MSKETVEKIVMQANSDSTFMKNLLKSPEEFLQSYELTEKEIMFFKQADEKMLNGLSSKCFKLADSK